VPWFLSVDWQIGEAIMNCIRRRPFRKNNVVLLFEPPFLCALPLVLLLSVVRISAAGAQTSGDAIYGVTSVDVAPSATSQGIALLKQYRDAARKQPGNQGVTLLQEEGWPNRFVIYEAWTDQSAYDANEKAAHTAELFPVVAAVGATILSSRLDPPGKHPQPILFI
jgi:quinol monooxygenase YgiN